MIADAIASGDHERVYDSMWLEPTNLDGSPPLTQEDGQRTVRIGRVGGGS